MQEKKTYQEPECQVTEFECEDIITASGGGVEPPSSASSVMNQWAHENNASIYDILYKDLER